MLRRLRLRYLAPVALISLCLVLLCTVTAVSLLQQQASLSVTLRENVASHQAAAELEECLFDLITLLQHRVEAVSSLHERVATHLDHLHATVDQEEERHLADQLEVAFTEYTRRWQAIPPQQNPAHEQAVREIVRYLETSLLRPCQDFELFNKLRITHSAENHEIVLSRLAWGMASVGGLAAVAGLVLGFGVARGVSQSIARLRVQIHDAAGKLSAAPDIVLTEDGDFCGLHLQLDQLSQRIEGVVQQLHDRETEILRAEHLAAVGQLAAGVAHEIRNPLTSIKLLVQSGMEDTEGTDLSREDLQVMEAEILRMEKSLQTFLDFTRPARPERRPLQIEPLITGVVNLIRGRASKQGVNVRVEIAPEVGTVRADGAQLHQVLVNLCLNALDAMPTGGTITIRVFPVDSDSLSIELSDSGPGIAPEMMPRLFRPFVSTKETGLGLGLVISQRIVEAHGGSLTACNQSTGGAQFTVNLPTTPQQENTPCPIR